MTLGNAMFEIFSTSREMIEAATCYWEDKPGFPVGGGTAIATAKTREVLEEGVRLRLDRIDRYRSPEMSSGPRQREDGVWTATIVWWGLD